MEASAFATEDRQELLPAAAHLGDTGPFGVLAKPAGLMQPAEQIVRHLSNIEKNGEAIRANQEAAPRTAGAGGEW